MPAAIVNGGGDAAGKVQFSELHRRRDLDLNLESGHTVIRHTVVHHSSTCRPMYTPNFIEIGKVFLDGLTAGTPPGSRSRDTKTRTNFKNPARTNLDIVL